MLWLCGSNFAVYILLMIYSVTVSRSAFITVLCGRYQECMSLIVVFYLDPVKPVSSTVATFPEFSGRKRQYPREDSRWILYV